MTTNICVFEDPYVRHLLPLVYMRPVYDLRCGMLTLLEKIRACYGDASFTLHVRSYLSSFTERLHPGHIVNPDDAEQRLYLNGRVLADNELAHLIPVDGPEGRYVMDDILVAARVKAGFRFRSGMPEALTPADFAGLPIHQYHGTIIRYPWDLVQYNGAQIEEDSKRRFSGQDATKKGKIYDGVHLLNPSMIAVGEGTTIKPGTVLDAEEGPIVVGKNVKILPHATIEGPAFVGDGSTIKVGAKIYGSTSIGEICKVGGEVEGSIIHSYSNKQHDGFLGHSYLGSWVNIGADTNNSDLKNNYGNVRMVIDGESIDTGSMFMGLVMGDHSKSGINTMFNTGTVVGFSSNVFGSGYPPKVVPSFAWGGAEEMKTYDLLRAIDVARRVMARRKQELGSVEEEVFKAIFDMTVSERQS